MSAFAVHKSDREVIVSDDDLSAAEFDIAAAAIRGRFVQLADDDIQDPRLRAVVDAARTTYLAIGSVSAVDVVACMRADGTIERLRSRDGAARIIDLVVDLVAHRPLFFSLEYHARMIRNAGRRRRLARRALDLHLAARDDGDVDAALERLLSLLGIER